MYAVIISRILLGRERVASFCATLTARAASLVKLIDRLFSLLVSCKVSFPVVGFKISSLSNFTSVCPNRIHDEHMHLHLLTYSMEQGPS